MNLIKNGVPFLASKLELFSNYPISTLACIKRAQWFFIFTK
jgi:hypothetical protein